MATRMAPAAWAILTRLIITIRTTITTANTSTTRVSWPPFAI
jgi:hypothetical protein